jgi:hypothetical protein
VIQRCGSALNLNPHFDSLCLDGVFARNERGELDFHDLGTLSDQRMSRDSQHLETQHAVSGVHVAVPAAARGCPRGRAAGPSSAAPKPQSTLVRNRAT